MRPGMNYGRSIGLVMVAAALLGVVAPGCGEASLDPGECDEDNPCENGDECHYPTGSCAQEVKGTCVRILSCDGPESGPVCGCDGQVIEAPYGTCQSGGRSSHEELCAQGTFACGDKQCTRHKDLCVATSGGPAGSETTYECIKAYTVPNCLGGIPDCGCLFLEDLGCADSSCCSADADMQETITIQLP
jgi:hypothetical protein